MTRPFVLLVTLSVLVVAGCNPPPPVVVTPPECTTAADCNDSNACTADACDAAGSCQHTAVNPDDHDACTTDACDPHTGVSHVAISADDGNACTTDHCDPATGVSHTAVNPDDGNPCTVDSCDPTTGVAHALVALDDADACTDDSCDPLTGNVFHAPRSGIDDANACTEDVCDRLSGVISHAPYPVDDGNACTADSCDPTTGMAHVAVTTSDNNACTVDACDPVTGVSHTPVATDDSNACTTDSCDPSTGVHHVAVNTSDGNACTVDACDPTTGVSHTPVAVDDGNACTTDSCNPANGTISHTAASVDDGNACTTDSCNPSDGSISHAPVNPDDGNVCTTDSCDPATGVKHVAVSVDDGDACTADSCDPSTGVSHTAINPDDGIACTDDSCDPATGVHHVAVHSRCEVDGLSCTVATCSLTTGCSEVPTDSACDDGIACDQHRCVGASGDAQGCAPHTTLDAACNPGEVCHPTGCVTQVAGDQRGEIIVSEFSALGTELVELHNTTVGPIDVHGFVLKNFANQSADLRAVTDLSGSAGTAVTIPAGGYAYGVRNPSSGGVPAGPAFVYGAPGTAFALADTGDVLSVYSTGGALLEDVVDFRQLVTSSTVAPGTSFVAFAGTTTQLDPASLDGQSNDSAAAWCTSFYPATGTQRRVVNTAGAANGSCHAVVINELLVHSAAGDDGHTYVELAGPGGADLSGITLADLDTNGALVADGDFGAGEVDGQVTLPAGTRMPANGFLLVADGLNDASGQGFTGTSVSGFRSGVDVVVRDMDLTDGPGSLQLIAASGTALLDVVGHAASGASLAASTGFNGLPTYETATAVTPAADQALYRSGASDDTGSNAVDFHDGAATPGARNKALGASLSVHLTLGQPDDATVDPAQIDKYLSIKPQYVTSYNGTRKNPNYSAWELNASWKGPAPRQDTFRPDDTLPPNIPQASLADYQEPVYDRGHMCPSDDRDKTNADNSATFYLTNMVPQATNNNQGPWQKLEAYLQCLAVMQGKEIFIASGGLYELGVQYIQAGSTLQVPSDTWKVVTILDAPGQGAADVTATTRAFAVVMPNDNARISRTANWRTFVKSVREVEGRTGYNFMSDVSPSVQDVIEPLVDNNATTCTCPSGRTCVSGTF